MAMLDSAGNKTVTNAFDRLQQLLGRPLEDAEKTAIAQLQALADHILDRLDGATITVTLPTRKPNA